MIQYQCMGCRKIWELKELDEEMTPPFTCLDCGQHVQLLAASNKQEENG